MNKIREDLGPDAVILDSNPVRSKGIGGLFKQGVEVVAAYEPAAAREAEKAVLSEPRAPQAPQMKASEPKPERPLHVIRPAAAYTAPEPVAFPVFEPEDAAPEPARMPDLSRRTVLEPDNRKSMEPQAARPAPQGNAFVQYQKEIDPLSDQIASLKDVVQDFTQRVSLMNKDTALGLPPDILNLYSGLIERDVPEELARQVAAQAQMVQSRRPVKAETAAQQIIMDRLGETSPIRLKTYRQNVLFFVGPTGAGKTTTLVKLAGTLTIQHKLRVGLINMDTYRIGAMEHMRIYADIMDLPLQTAYSAAELAGAIEALSDRDVILVDTAGKSTGDEAYQKEMEECLRMAQADEVYLVVSVSTGHRACREIVQNYSFLPDYKLIVTKLDEVSAWGNVLNIRELTHRQLAYVTVGQNVPDDIRPADSKRLADNIVGKRVSVL